MLRKLTCVFIGQAIPPHEPLDTSAARSRAELASRGGLAMRQSPSQGLLRRSGGGTSMSSNSSLERSIEETRADAMDSTTTSAESASAVINRSQDNQFHEAYFVSRLVVLFQNGASSFKIDFYIFFLCSTNRSSSRNLESTVTTSAVAMVGGRSFASSSSVSSSQQQQYYQHHYHVKNEDVPSYFHEHHAHPHLHQQAPPPPPHQHYPYAESMDHRSVAGTQMFGQPRSLPHQQHVVNEQLKQLLGEREQLKRDQAEPQRLQPATSSNRSLSMERPMGQQQQQQSHVFYPVRTRSEEGALGLGIESQLRNSMRSNEALKSSSSAHSLATAESIMSSMSSSVVSVSSTSSSTAHPSGSWQQIPANEWGVEQVCTWLRSIGKLDLIRNSFDE